MVRVQGPIFLILSPIRKSGIGEARNVEFGT